MILLGVLVIVYVFLPKGRDVNIPSIIKFPDAGRNKNSICRVETSWDSSVTSKLASGTTRGLSEFLIASYKSVRDLASGVRTRCGSSNRKTSNRKVVPNFSSKSKKVWLCSIWKVGSTFLKRLFMINNLPEYKDFVDPFNISFLAKYDNKLSVLPTSKDVQKFMFVRDPYHRLLSGYVDKLLAPNPVYWKILGVPAIRFARKSPDPKSLSCGHDLTFREYIKYVVAAMTSPIKVRHDMHFDSYTALCNPCQINYDFVGKLENIEVDLAALLSSLNLSKTIELLALKGSSLLADDAIRDTTYQPFDPGFGPKLQKCLNRLEVFQRSWSKLKIRGLIGNYNLTIDLNAAINLTYTGFLEMARNAYRKSTKEERKRIQHKAFVNMFSTVDKDDMETIPKAYADDFKLFNFEARPKELFKI